MEFSDIYTKIRQGLNDQDYTLLEEGMKELLRLPPLEQILSQDLIEIINCLVEIIKTLFPASAERMGAFAERMDEFFEEASGEESQESEPEEENPKVEENFYDISLDIRIVTEKYFAHFTKFTPSVQDAFIKFLKFGAPLAPEIYRSNFQAFLDYFETQPAKRLEFFSNYLDYGGNIVPGEIIQIVSERLFTLAKDPHTEKVLFASYLGSFLLQFYDIYPDSVEDKIGTIIALLNNPEYYFRSFAVDVLKTLIQSRPEALVSYFLEMLKLLTIIDPKIQSTFLLSIRDLLNMKNSTIFESFVKDKNLSEQFIKTVTDLMLKSNFEVGDFACEVFFDFLPKFDQDAQVQLISRLIRLWKKMAEVSTYHIMLMQNFSRKTKLVQIKFMNPDELENPENLKVLLLNFEVAIEAKLKGAFKNKQNYDSFN